MRAMIVMAALMLGACATTGFLDERISHVEVLSGYSRSGFSAFAAAGPSVEMHGPLPGGVDAEAVAQALRLPGWFPQTPFQAVEPGASPRGQRIVLVFGTSGGLDMWQVCRGEVSAGAVTERLVVGAAYCTGGRAGSTASLSHARMLTPDDPQFTASMRRLFSALAPQQDERTRDRGDRCLIAPC